MKQMLDSSRKAVWNGNLYVIHDVFDVHGRLVTCLYAVRDANRDVVWKQCGEGVEFSEIEPFEKAA